MHTSQPSDSSRGVDLVVAQPGLPLLLGQVLGIALERVVHHLGRVEELLAPVDHLPLAVEPDVDHQRDQRVEDLRHAAAERGRRDVEDALALQPLGALADLVDQRAADDARVVGEVLVGDGDGLEHGGAPAIGASARHDTGAVEPRALSARSAAQPRDPGVDRPHELGVQLARWRPRSRTSGTRGPSRAAGGGRAARPSRR